ncbi:MAG: Rrf2 family transcriptional regulator [Candidatus Eisenbacteria bacterium]
MKLPTKIRYAVRAVVELAEREGRVPVPVKTIAEAQEVSPKYAKQLMNRLQKAGIVRGYPGIHGGYVLAKDPGGVSVYDIYRAMGVALDLAPCVGRNAHCTREDECSASRVWKRLRTALEKTLREVSIEQLAAEERSLRAGG